MVIYNRRMIFVFSLVLLLFLLIGFTSCRDRQTSPSIEKLEAIANIDDSNYKGRIITDETRNEIKNILNQYEKDIAGNINKKEELGSLYKRLGIKYLEIDRIKSDIQIILADNYYQIDTATEREDTVVTEALAYSYIDKGIYRVALYYFEKAIEIYPENELLFYYSGLCSAKIAKSIIRDYNLQAEWLFNAEQYYKTAIELDPYYSDALYALSVLYIYEYASPLEAEKYLLELKNIEQYDTDARFLLANVYYMTERYEDALLEYNDILKITKLEEIRENVKANQNQIIKIMESVDE